MTTCYPLCKYTPKENIGNNKNDKCPITDGNCIFWGSGQTNCDFYKPMRGE